MRTLTDEECIEMSKQPGRAWMANPDWLSWRKTPEGIESERRMNETDWMGECRLHTSFSFPFRDAVCTITPEQVAACAQKPGVVVEGNRAWSPGPNGERRWEVQLAGAGMGDLVLAALDLAMAEGVDPATIVDRG